MLLTLTIALFFSFFFSGMEFLFLSANKLKIELDKDKGQVSGRILSYFVKHDRRFVSTLLMGNVVSLVITCYAFIEIIYPILEQWLLGNAYGITAVIIILMALISLLMVEFLPRTIFQINPNKTIRYFAIPLLILYALLFPLSLIYVQLGNMFLFLFGVKSSEVKGTLSRADLDVYVRDINERREEQGELDNEMQILQNALDFSGVKARDCMIPRTDIVAMEMETSMDDLKHAFIESGFSKILIYKETIDNIVGYVHCFDLFSKPQKILDVFKPIAFVPEAIFAKNLLEIFAKQTGNIAVVVDEYGGTSGMVTIEDVVEEIIGDIEDEHDKDELLEEQLDEHTFLFSARQDIDYLNENYHFDLEESSEYETLGGIVIHHLERIPEEGDTVIIGGYSMEVIHVSERRIEEIKITKIEAE